MTTQPSPPSEKPRKRVFPFPAIIIVAAVVAVVMFLLATPDELVEYT